MRCCLFLGNNHQALSTTNRNTVKTINKKTIRAELLSKRSNINKNTQKSVSAAICTQIQNLSIYQDAQKIAFYQAINGEIDLFFLFEHALEEKKQCYMPRVLNDSKTLLFLPTTLDTPQTANQWGILEPDVPASEHIAAQQIDIMLIPLVAFNSKGARLGRGAGFYDRTLAHQKPKYLIGVGYEFQKYEALAPDVWDIPLTATVTEKSIYWSTS